PVHRKEFLEKYAHLKETPEFLPYVFTADEVTTLMKWLEHLIAKVFPRPNIPRGLKIVRSFSFQPPRFFYGWAMDFATAHKLGMLAEFVDPIPLEQLENESTTPVISQFHATKRLNRWLYKYMPKTMKRLKWVSFEYVRGEHRRGPESLKCCISLADSYISGNRKPDLAAVKVLQQALGIGTEFSTFGNSQALWWIDAFRGQRQWLSHRDHRQSVDRRLLKIKKEMIASHCVPSEGAATSGLPTPVSS
ncbi:hypothetical protein BKA70DRAFT_1130595, partial [Coprinopsis sp. MPI-PUGE-AT-0042]